MLEEGWAWETQKGRKPELVWTNEREGHDKEESLPHDIRTMKRVQELANMLVDGIRFIIDLPERYI